MLACYFTVITMLSGPPSGSNTFMRPAVPPQTENEPEASGAGINAGLLYSAAKRHSRGVLWPMFAPAFIHGRGERSTADIFVTNTHSPVQHLKLFFGV